MNKNYRATVILIVTALLTSACINVPPVTSGIGSDQIAQGENFNEHLLIDNTQLAKKLYISNIKSRTINDLLQLNVTLASQYKKSLKLQYQFQWFDKDGFAIEVGKSPWQAIDLHGMQKIVAEDLAPSKEVATFSIYVREVPEKFFKF